MEGSGTLQLEQDLGFQRRAAALQRAGRVLLVLGLLAGLAGVFGTGPLSHASASAPGRAFSVDYDRVLRSEQSSSLEVSPQLHSKGAGSVSLSESYLNSVDLSDVTPQPDSETANADRVVLTYQGGLPSQVQIGISPDNIGVHRATVWVNGNPLSFHQVILP